MQHEHEAYYVLYVRHVGHFQYLPWYTIWRCNQTIISMCIWMYRKVNDSFNSIEKWLRCKSSYFYTQIKKKKNHTKQNINKWNHKSCIGHNPLPIYCVSFLFIKMPSSLFWFLMCSSSFQAKMKKWRGRWRKRQREREKGKRKKKKKSRNILNAYSLWPELNTIHKTSHHFEPRRLYYVSVWLFLTSSSSHNQKVEPLVASHRISFHV